MVEHTGTLLLNTAQGVGTALLFVALLPPAVRGDDGTDFFEKKVRPVLAEHCYACHSAGAKKEKGGLRLDTPAAIRAGGDNGPAVKAEDQDSLLLRAVTHADGTPAMPPKGKLPDAAVADLRTWVKMGAPLPAANRVGLGVDRFARTAAEAPVGVAGVIQHHPVHVVHLHGERIELARLTSMHGGFTCAAKVREEEAYH